MLRCSTTSGRTTCRRGAPDERAEDERRRRAARHGRGVGRPHRVDPRRPADRPRRAGGPGTSPRRRAGRGGSGTGLGGRHRPVQLDRVPRDGAGGVPARCPAHQRQLPLTRAGTERRPPPARRGRPGLRRGHDLTLIDNISASEGGPFGHAEARTEADLADGRFSLSPVARVLDEHDRDIRPGSGQVGVLASAGPQPVGYLNAPDRTARTWRTIDGVRHAVPGDLATLDEDGTLVLLGRGDSVITTGGEKVFPEEVEQALLTHPGIADAVVVGVPDARWGQVVTALVAPASALTAVTDDAVTTYVGDRLAGYTRPRHIVRVDAVTRSPAGKLNRALARELATRTVEETSR